MPGRTSLAAADVDQAFEACNSASVSGAWKWAARTFKDTTGYGHVQVARCKKCKCKLAASGWIRAWWILTLDQLGRSLLAAASTTFAVLGDAVVALDGMSIRGPLSSAAVATRFAEEESRAIVSPGHVKAGFGLLGPSDVSWARYVDDVLGASNSVWATCLLEL